MIGQILRSSVVGLRSLFGSPRAGGPVHFVWNFTVLAGVIGMAVYLCQQTWDHLGPRKPEVGPVRRQLAAQVIPIVVEDLRTSRQGIRSVALLHLENDPSDYITDQLRSAIEQSGILDVRDMSFTEKLRTVLRLRHRSYGAAGPAISRGKAFGVQGVVFGTVHAFESYKGGAKIDLQVQLADVTDKKALFERRYVNESPVAALSQATIQEQAAGTSPAYRFIAWLVVVLLLPVFTIGFIRAMVRKESNKANAFTLCIYTGVDALLAFLLLGAQLTSWFPVLLFIAAVGIAFAYNVSVMKFALKLET